EVLPMSIVKGILELSARADGRLRQLDNTYVADPTDPVVPAQLLEQYALRGGVEIEVELGKTMGGAANNGQGGGHHGGGKRGRGKKKKPKLNAIDPQARRVNKILSVDGMPPEEFAKVRKFEDLTSIDPQPRLTLEYPGCPPACRLIDLFCPIGYGQRGMIVSPPKAGKTTILQNIANSVRKNHPDVVVIAILVDERPEEVTDFRRNVPCTVWASSNDHPPQRHVGLAMLAADRCKRLAEQGKDVL